MGSVDVSAVLFQELLDHFWRVHNADQPPVLKLYPDGCLITYATLCTKAGMRELTHQIGQPLYSIAVYCAAQHWQPLTALVVHHETRYPSMDYFGAPGCATDVDGWMRDVANVLQFNGYPHVAPPLPAASASEAAQQQPPRS